MSELTDAQDAAWADLTRGETEPAPGDDLRRKNFNDAFAKGWNAGRDALVPSLPEEEIYEQPALKDYKQSDPLQVLKHGSWMNGRISSRDEISGHLHVETERGPVTVGSTQIVRRRKI